MANVVCLQCGKEFERKNGQVRYNRQFCSLQCLGTYRDQRSTSQCSWCGADVIRSQAELKNKHRKSDHVFCNRSCAVSYNNTTKRKSRRSKMEAMLFDMLVEHYPDLQLVANDKSALDGYELDIYIPSIKLAIEWNGIVHFKPIYGQAKLSKIQQRDSEKQHLAEQSGINLIVIPDLASTEIYVKEAFHNIRQIIDELQSAS